FTARGPKVKDGKALRRPAGVGNPASRSAWRICMQVPLGPTRACAGRTAAPDPRLAAMEYAGKGGWIEVVSGVMFSGKSEELLRRIRRATLARRQVQVFKSHLDERYGGLSVV